ncbi:MAG TPA: hypothetical protein VMV68_06115 [Spirochaetia bacterium]|nr:hypothetical protein [Spirochaetia bacterium]
MKRLLPLLMLIIAPALLQAQADQPQARKYLHNIGVSDVDITKIFQTEYQTQRQVREVQLELNILRAELEKALFPVNADMHEVQRLLNESLQWKLKSELATINARVEIRKLLGDVKYAEYQRYLHDERVKASRRASAEQRGNGQAGGGQSPAF